MAELYHSPRIYAEFDPIGYFLITDIPQNLHSLKNSAQELERLRLAATAAGAGIWDYDIDADRLFCDDRWHEILGLDPADPLRSVAEFKPHIHPEDADRATEVDATFDDLTARDRDYRILFRIIRADGSVRWVRSVACLIQSRPNGHKRAVGAIVDVTDEISAQAAVAESEQLFKMMANTVPQIIFSAQPGGKIDYLNRRWQEFTGASEPGDNDVWRSFLHPDDRDRVADTWRRAMESGEIYRDGFRYRHTSGEYRWMTAEAVPLRDEQGRIQRWFGSNTDVHDAKQLEAERELVALELDHRLKNIFTLFGSLIHLSARNEPEAKPYTERLQGSLSALVTAHDLIRQGEKDDLTLKALLRRLLDPYEDPAAPRIALIGADAEICSRTVTPLSLLFHELATNAAKYGALRTSGGSLKVSIERTERDVLIDWTERSAWSPPGGEFRPAFERLRHQALRSGAGQATWRALHEGSRSGGIPRPHLRSARLVGAPRRLSRPPPARVAVQAKYVMAPTRATPRVAPLLAQHVRRRDTWWPLT